MQDDFEYVFPAIRGTQAHREFYISMCPLRLIPKVFLFNEEELVPELRAQRVLNSSRIPEMARYIVDNPKDYVFSALTASVDGDLKFIPHDGDKDSSLGCLHIPMSAQFVINDGQHRRAAIEVALREKPELADENISVVFFYDAGLKRSQQMFADLNRHAVKPSTSLGVLYDHRDDKAEISRQTVAKTRIFKDLVEMEKSTLSARSRRLFTFSAIHLATVALLATMKGLDITKASNLASEFWQEVSGHIPEWEKAKKGEMSSGEIRADFIHSHGVFLQALGKAGNILIKKYPKTWKKNLKGMEKIDWSRGNSTLWEGRALVNGRVSKASTNIGLTTNIIKEALGLELYPGDLLLEKLLKEKTNV